MIRREGIEWLTVGCPQHRVAPRSGQTGGAGGRKAGVSESCTACGTRATNRSPFSREKTHRSVPQLTTEIIKAQIAHGGASKRMEQLNRSRSSADFLPPGGKARPLCSGQDRRSVDERVCAYDDTAKASADRCPERAARTFFRASSASGGTRQRGHARDRPAAEHRGGNRLDRPLRILEETPIALWVARYSR